MKYVEQVIQQRNWINPADTTALHKWLQQPCAKVYSSLMFCLRLLKTFFLTLMHTSPFYQLSSDIFKRSGKSTTKMQKSRVYQRAHVVKLCVISVLLKRSVLRKCKFGEDVLKNHLIIDISEVKLLSAAVSLSRFLEIHGIYCVLYSSDIII